MIEQSSPQYWNKTAEDFDSIYSGQDKSRLGRFLDEWLRKDMFLRMDETVRIVNSLGDNQTILDVGTGTGRLCISLAEAGHNVVGADFSSEMLGHAERITAAAGVGDLCDFVQADLLHDTPEELQQYQFDVVVALGVLDYISDPSALMERMASFNPKKVVVAFPKQGTLRCYLRQMRYKVQRLDCPLFFYTREQIRDLKTKTGAKKIEIRSMGQLYYAVYDL